MAKSGGQASIMAARSSLGLAVGAGIVVWTMVETEKGCAAENIKPGALLLLPTR